MWTRGQGRAIEAKHRIIETRPKFSNPIDFTPETTPKIKKVAIEELEKYGSGSVRQKLQGRDCLLRDMNTTFTDNGFETLKEEGFAVYATKWTRSNGVRRETDSTSAQKMISKIPAH